jgi:uncharacterized membrane protein YoaK (UPF0700 family)
VHIGSGVDLLNIKNFFILLIIITLSPAATSTCQSFSMRTSPEKWHICVILHIIILRAVVGTWVGITTDCHVTSRQILLTGGSLDPS